MRRITTHDELEAEAQRHAYLLLKISASWCNPCQIYSPVIESVSKTRSDISVAEVDVDDMPAIRETFHVRSVPTLIMFKNGSAVDSLIGSQAVENVHAWIDHTIQA
ncbi:MAG: thioredoxin family protein [Pseudomonadota bacterium]|uniref:thioredoxin family protein n=1 Tax=Methylophaga aminisulfidivorans TaxID=230105 RepID=UPI0024E245BF|nr:thioredoxin family protein [Methylophaga aminisulfidivorans]MEC9412799.1 thioredoxin family protein [Pseudomonadota bacterium]